MIELVKYFRILFMSVKISRERLKAFADDHIERLTENNPGHIFDTILADVTEARNDFSGDVSGLSVKEVQKEGKTVTLSEARTDLQKNISDNENLIAYTYRNNASTYEEFYPLGVSEYHDADTANFKTITIRYREILDDHKDDFTNEFVTEYNDLQTAFVNALSQQSAAKGRVSGEISDIATTRPALARQLTVNLLTIALKYVGDETKAGVYFDQGILDAAFRESSRKVTSDINPAETQNIFDNITKADVRITIKNTGEGVLNFGFKADEDTVISDTLHTVEPGQEITLSAAELGWTGTNAYLNVTNNGTLAGSYVAEKV